jgi:hypothetical protein
MASSKSSWMPSEAEPLVPGARYNDLLFTAAQQSLKALQNFAATLKSQEFISGEAGLQTCILAACGPATRLPGCSANRNDDSPQLTRPVLGLGALFP